MSHKKFFNVIAAITLILTLPPEKVAAKSKAAHSPQTITAAVATSSSITALEQRLTPFLTSMAIRRQNKNTFHTPVQSALLEQDIFTCAKLWNSLSPGFRKLYQQSISIPGGLEMHVTPGGHFEIYYSTSGAGMVDTTDTIGFSTDDWRRKTASPNGIPDYIDETAFTLDSCWTMQIDRFGFQPPVAYQDSAHKSNLYKVVVEEQPESYYGLTYLSERSNISEKGFASYISMRNSWSDPEWSDLGYDKKPLNGISVTCAHEFFHAIQYSMSWNIKDAIWLDNFPYSWTEGSAVSMEELAFSSINDYHQYARTYFSTPSMSFFSNTTSNLVYTNAILFIYLYSHIRQGGSIDFLHSMLSANYSTEQMPFDRNLLAAGACCGSSWQKLLHDFHCSSFKTGIFADTTSFIADAGSFSMVKVTPISEIDTVHRLLATNSASHIRLVKSYDHDDTVSISVTCGSNNGSSAKEFLRPGYSIRLSTSTADSLISMTTDTNGTGTIKIGWWKKWSDLTVVATNADPVSTVPISIFIQPYKTTGPQPDLTVYPNPLSLKNDAGTLFFRGNNIEYIRIYSLNGVLVWKNDPQNTTSATQLLKTYQWNAHTPSKIVPGLYHVIIGQKNGVTNKMKRTFQKLMIVP